MEHDETGCHASPEGPILCINNCGFFGSAATMNMCSKCHKDMILKQEQTKLAASSIENIVNGKEPAIIDDTTAVTLKPSSSSVEPKVLSVLSPTQSGPSAEAIEEGKVVPKRCATCKKRVGLTGFKCRCGNMFCGSHRYSDKHGCLFDYHGAAQDAIAKANPIVKAEKLNKI
ncbi:zinc finger A20 and AN1 domain-containing stress-associated protein 8-like [Impatiens glandulifera]|uniref:zinc finger A20 and AN1 domain-containing stress-associated protein 8-like n=1 Tax=Impatiens glandulifera TaxID=253017 RepID=UPI001FB0AFEB|nr:zinc finger A20 and AN1 domain-containing stress-associated protein 8-like [Impatiens glandulifera]